MVNLSTLQLLMEHYPSQITLHHQHLTFQVPPQNLSFKIGHYSLIKPQTSLLINQTSLNQRRPIVFTTTFAVSKILKLKVSKVSLKFIHIFIKFKLIPRIIITTFKNNLIFPCGFDHIDSHYKIIQEIM